MCLAPPRLAPQCAGRCPSMSLREGVQGPNVAAFCSQKIAAISRAGVGWGKPTETL